MTALKKLVVLIVSMLAVGAGRADHGAKGPELTFLQDGNDLVVTARVTVNDSPHVLWTDVSADSSARAVTLRYVVIQNRDLLVRSQKQVDVTWRLPGRTKGHDAFRVEATTMQPTSAELRQLVPGLQQLAEQGKRVRPGAEVG